MPFMLTKIHVEDYDAWKPMFDQGRTSVRSAAKGHRILRSVEDPNELFIQVEFDSTDDARAAHDELLASGALDRVEVRSAPTVAEMADAVSY
ncbi:MAG TPA: hypothetical protein VF587_16755 [Solirubrobacteraceae bacterium]|jgi:hypothetical protein